MAVQIPAAAAAVYAVAKRYGIPIANKSLTWVKKAIETYKNRNKVSAQAIGEARAGTKSGAAGRSADIQRMQKAELKKSAAARAKKIADHKHKTEMQEVEQWVKKVKVERAKPPLPSSKVSQYGTTKGSK
jgi:hypothetical protein